MPNESDAAKSFSSTVVGKIQEHLDTASPVLTEFGNYEILGEVARGGVGIIYKVRQRGLERIVALKVLQSGTSTSSEHVQRFLHEAQSAAKLQHPNIVPIHDFGTHDGMYFFTMDFVEGESLADRVARGPIPAREALEFVRETAEALHYAHEHGVIHRDIKPGNILLDKDGRVKVTDFGIAKEVERAEDLRLTVTGQVMGTPRYMSPEQASGQTAKADRRSDIFSLGVTLYEMLTGKAAFDAESVFTVLQKVTDEDPPPPHKLNRKIHNDASTICQKAMEKAPSRRYQTAKELAEDTERFLSGEPIEARPVSSTARLLRRMCKHWKLLLINAVVLSVVGYLVKYYTDYYLASRPSHLSLQVQTANTHIVVDDIIITENELSLKPGKHRLEADLEPLYESQEINFETQPAERLTLPISLARRTGRLDITTDPPDAAVTIITPSGANMPFRGPHVEQELPTGRYITLVHRENYLAQQIDAVVESRQTRSVRFVLPPITVWSVPTSGNVLSVPAVADMDSDGFGDTIVGDDDGKIYCLSGKNGVVLWLFNAQDAVQAPIGLADMNGDGVPDVLAGSTDRHLYCLNGKDGKLLWSFTTGGPILGPPRLKDINGDGVLDLIFNNGPDEIIALNGKNGEVLGRIKLDEPVGRGYSLEDVDRDGVPDVTVGAGRKVYCFSWVGGRKKWLAKSDTYYDAPLAQADGKLITKNQAGLIAAYTADSAQPLWKFPTSPQTPPYNGVAVGQGFVVDADPHTRTLRTIAAATGVELWTAKLPGAADTPIGWPALANDLLLIGDADNGLHCLTATNGALRWTIALPKVTVAAAIGKDFACVADGEGTLHCIALADGQQRWQYRPPTGGTWPSQPTLADLNGDGVEDVIAVNDGGHTYAINGRDGKPLWLFPHAKNRQRTRNHVVLTGPKTGILATADGDVFCLDLVQGKPIWSVPLKEAVLAEPTLADLNGDGVADILVGTMNRRLHCLDGRNGALLWSYEVGGQIRYTTPQVLANKLVFIATGPPENGLYCLHGDCVRENARAWFGPWRSLSLTK